MGGQEIEVHAGLVVVTLEERLGGELHQVVVADVVLGEQDHVVADVLAPGRPVEAGPWRDIGLDADDRLDLGLGRSLHEVDHAIHDTVVGDRHSRLAVGRSRLDDFVHPGRAIEHRELGVQMQMCERGHSYRSVIRTADTSNRETAPNCAPGLR